MGIGGGGEREEEQLRAKEGWLLSGMNRHLFSEPLRTTKSLDEWGA